MRNPYDSQSKREHGCNSQRYIHIAGQSWIWRTKLLKSPEVMNSLRVPVSYALLSSYLQLAHERSVLEFKSWTWSSQVVISLGLRLPNHLGDNPGRSPTEEPASAIYSCAQVHDVNTNRNLFGCTNTLKHWGSTTKRLRVPRFRFHLPNLNQRGSVSCNCIDQSKYRFAITSRRSIDVDTVSN